MASEQGDPRTTSKQQALGFNVDGYHCWTGPSGTRYAAPGDRRSVFGVLAGTSDLSGVSIAVAQWLRGQ